MRCHVPLLALLVGPPPMNVDGASWPVRCRKSWRQAPAWFCSSGSQLPTHCDVTLPTLALASMSVTMSAPCGCSLLAIRPDSSHHCVVASSAACVGSHDGACATNTVIGVVPSASLTSMRLGSAWRQITEESSIRSRRCSQSSTPAPPALSAAAATIV